MPVYLVAEETDQIGIGEDLIEQGWEVTLRTLFPSTFTGEFADFHREFWEWYWPCLVALRDGKPLPVNQNAFLAIWPRGGGKSSCVECAAIVTGAVLGWGYVLYVSASQKLAQGHLQSIRERLESSEVAGWFPGLGSPRMGKYGNQAGWRQDFLYTENGWGVAAYGLDVGVRGGRLGDTRPSLIILDDIDDDADSPGVIEKKIDTIARGVLPTGTKNTLILFAQNLIHRNSVLNQALTGKAPILQNRIVSGPHPALRGLRIERQGIKDIIVAGEPAWSHMDMEAAQQFLSNSGPTAFLAEYQHDLEASQEGLVIPEFDEKIHVITWSEFARVYGAYGIPSHWIRDVSMDWGSTGLDAHPCIISSIATSAEDSPLPNTQFLFLGMSFGAGVLVDEVAEALAERIGAKKTGDGARREIPNGYRIWRMSHEAKSERDTLRRKFGFPFVPADAGKTAGIAQLRHYLRVDRTLPHPFKEGVMGASNFYWVVEDDQLESPVDDLGLKRHREEIIEWRWRPMNLSSGGMGREVPTKWMDDAMDSLKMIAQKWFPPPAPLTLSQKVDKYLPEHLRERPEDPKKQGMWELQRWVELGKAKDRARREDRVAHWRDAETVPPIEEHWAAETED